MNDNVNKLILNNDIINVITQNPGLNLSLSDVQNVTLEGGCVRFIRYGKNSDDLTMVRFDNGTVLSSSATPTLADFRESFECAAKHGMAVTYCITRDRKTLSMVNLYPCLCSCGSKEGDGKGHKASEIFGLSAS